MNKSTLKTISEKENIPLSLLKKNIEAGKAVIVKNRLRKVKPLAIGKGLRVKTNANIGTSSESPDIKDEIKKLKVAEHAGADSVMDLSVTENLKSVRKRIIAASKIIVGTVPIYECAIKAEKQYGSFERMTKSEVIETIEEQAKEGVDFFTIHAGVTKEIILNDSFKQRTGGIVSRGGAILSRWMVVNKKENPLYEYFDDILDIAKKYDITLSLGDGLRPGALSDSLDTLQLSELLTLGKLTRRARKKGVKIIIEGPGHVPIDQIETNMRLEKQICGEAPFYVLGPLVTDIALGFDHISSAIGGAIAALYGADFLCVVTPKEHLGHPDEKDIKEGVIAARIAAHSADIIHNPKLKIRDDNLSKARRKRDWKTHIELSLNPGEVKKRTKGLKFSDVCSMCGKYCSLKIMETCPLK